ncbi:DUF3298 and DUF4163 domain-containing protein [Spirosoma sp. RP8]|uniref:DUF3298 and DUF4163 domain-containing protein n=1 Tax=Spirosoma liriopis TaxID=2937440 RepID=A0ABT0HKP9_9BACT|nr:DUF3298 and DUF4163 domain-containing protein [Spirosoma liriopis]MCK8492751.1 DUF3298 and DUF4163 domain-containing protein [Spirosoma liriopis]
MKYLFAALLCGSTVFFAACNRFKSGPPELDRKQYDLTGESKCDTSLNKGVDVSVSYFLLKEDSQVARTINDSMRHISVGSIVGWLDSATVARNPEARTDISKAATLFAADYEAMMKDMDKLGGCWELKTTADTVYTSPNAITVKVETYAYTGGAHPNSNLAFYTFDRETGRTLALNDLVSDTTALLGVVEKAFRKQQDLLPQYNLEERGYFLRDGQFFLPANIAVGRGGLIFYYNPYEIAAYAVGPIEVTVPYEQLNGILRDSWY